MKHLKRIALISFVLVLAAGLLCACGEKQPDTETGYAVVLTYDKEKGDVTLSDPAEGTRYAAGESVTLTVSPKEGFETDSVLVDGVPVSLTEGKYTFTVEKDVAVAVLFIEAGEGPDVPVEPTPIPAAALAEISGKVTFDGSYTQTYTTDEVTTVSRNVYTSFGEDTVWVRETDESGEEVVFDYVGVNRDGMLALLYHDLNNEIAYLDSFGIPFAEAYNPFALCDPSDFELAEEGVYGMTDLEKAKSCAEAITGYSENVVSLLLFMDGDRVESILIQSEDNPYIEELGYYYDAFYSYDVRDVGTGALPENFGEPYESIPEHAQLTAALEQAAAAESYTVSRDDNDGEDTYHYDVYVTEEAVHAVSGNVQEGYLRKGDTVYPYSYDASTGNAYLASPVEDEFSAFRASFTGFSPALFSYEGGGVYTLKSDFYVAGITSGVPALIASKFVAGGVSLSEYYAIDLQIVLEDGVLSSVSYRTVQDGYAGLTSLTFSDFSNTEIPVDLSNAKTLYEVYLGTYHGRDLFGETVDLEVTENSFLLSLNGEEAAPAENVFTDSGDGYFLITFNIGEKDYILLTGYGPQKNGFLLMTPDDDYTFQVMLLPAGGAGPEVPTVYPYAFYGTFEGDVESYHYTIVIDETGVTLIEDGSRTFIAAEDILYSDLDGLSLLLTDGEDSASYFIVPTEWNADYSLVDTIAFHNADDTYHVELTRTGAGDLPEVPFVMPAEYLAVGVYKGTYGGVDYYITFTEEEILVKIGLADAVSAEFTYDAAARNFSLTFNGEQYTLMNMSDTKDGAEKLQLVNEDWSLSVELTPFGGEIPDVPTISVSEKFRGTYKGTLNDSHSYIIVIGETTVTVAVDGGQAQEGVLTSFATSPIEEGYFTFGGKTFNFYKTEGDDTKVTKIGIMIDGSFRGQLDRDDSSEQPPAPPEDVYDVPARLVGTYKGTYRNKEYIFTFTATTVSVTIDGEAASVTKFDCSVSGTGSFSITITVNGEDLGLTTGSGTDPVEKLELLDMSDFSTVPFNRVGD